MKNIFLQFIYRALKKYAQKVLQRHKPFVIAVTGSVGKTTTKEFAYKLLCDEYGESNVRANAGNLNAEIGLPLTVLGYRNTPGKFELITLLVTAYFRTFVETYPKYLILEMGVEHPGDIDYFCSIVRPNIGIVTAATPSHVVNFKNLTEMQSEKIKLLKYVKELGIVNFDDEFIKGNTKDNAVGYSLRDKSADCFSKEISISDRGTTYSLVYKNKAYSVSNSLLGNQMIYSQMAAFLAAVSSGVNPEKAARSLNSLKAYPGRMNLLEGEDGTTVIDDTYNANPASSQAAVTTLALIKHKGRKVLIHGNMNEQGKEEKTVHLNFGKFVSDKVDFVVFFGPNAELMQKGFGNNDKSVVFKNRQELLQNIQKLVQPDDLVLVKASQNGNYLEEVTKILMKDKENVHKLLVRQSNNWLKKKR